MTAAELRELLAKAAPGLWSDTFVLTASERDAIIAMADELAALRARIAGLRSRAFVETCSDEYNEGWDDACSEMLQPIPAPPVAGGGGS